MAEPDLKEKIDKIQETLNHGGEYRPLQVDEEDEIKEEKIVKTKDVDSRTDPKENIKKIILFIIFLIFLKLLAMIF